MNIQSRKFMTDRHIRMLVVLDLSAAAMGQNRAD
jgi:hypothetical protein